MSLEEAIAWSVLIFGWAVPLAHIVLSRHGGPWGPPQGSGCPLGPRTGWAVFVLMLGPLGWLLFARRQLLNSDSAPER